MAEPIETSCDKNEQGQYLLQPKTEMHNMLGGYNIPYYKIPQVRFCHTKKRSKNKDITALKYKIDKNGFRGEGCTNQIHHVCSPGHHGYRNQYSLVKVIPDDFNKNTFEPKNLAYTNGRYYSLSYTVNNISTPAVQIPSNRIVTGSMGEFEEIDEKELIIGDYDQEFQLVYQGDTYEVDGLTCLKADIEMNGKEIIPGPTDHIYEFTSTNDRLVNISTLISPFAEDENCVRVVVLPCQSEGLILQPGNVLGTLKLVKPEDFERVKEVYMYTSNIVANLWLKENQRPKFLSKFQLQQLIKEWKENKEKILEELQKKKEEISEEKKKRVAEMERKRLENIEKKNENRKKMEEMVQMKLKKKQEKIEEVKQRQEEARKRKQEKFEQIRLEKEQEFNPVFGKPLEFGKPTGYPTSNMYGVENSAKDGFITSRRGSFEKPARGSFDKSARGSFDKSARGSFEKRNDSKPVCKFYTEGKCERGMECRFSHPGEEDPSSHGSNKEGFLDNSKPVCKHYTENKCEWGSKCRFSHPGEEGTSSHETNQEGYSVNSKPVCKHYTEGKCEWGSKCRFSHPGEEEPYSHEAKQNNKRSYPYSSGSGSASFETKLARVEQKDPRFDSPASDFSGRGSGFSGRGSSFSNRGNGFSGRGNSFSGRESGVSDRGSGYGLSSFGSGRDDQNEFFNPPSMVQRSTNSRFESNSGFLFEERRSMYQIPQAGSSGLSSVVQKSWPGNNSALSDDRGTYGRNIDMRRGPSVPAVGASVKDIEMERLEVQMRKKKLMEDILNSQKELLKLETAEDHLLKIKSDFV